jgi:hypothetical protein
MTYETIDDPTTLAWVCARRGERVRALFAALNLALPGLAAVQAAVEAGAWEDACAALLDYYRGCDSGSWLRHDPVPEGDGTVAAMSRMAEGFFPVPGGEVAVPRLPSGHLDWGHVPPVTGGGEWAYGLNRHDYMTEMLAAFYATGNRIYARALNDQLYDWVVTIEQPADLEANAGKCPWGTILEVGHRAKVWPAIFYGLQPEAALTPATRILVLCRALEHAQFLHTHYAGGSNWVITEMSGLLSIACAFPELRDADTWRTLALELTTQELQAQMYPDGVQKELSSNYQLAVLWHMDFFVATVRGAGLPLDPVLAETLERMWQYLAYSLGPTGLSPQNSDSDRVDGTGSTTIRVLEAARPLLNAATAHGREDWRYIGTNGAQGTQPAELPSAIFPWAGQLVSRSGWEREAHWSFFDCGPWGILHQHNDMLHLSLMAGGRDLLVDSGRYTYENYIGEAGTWRSYFIGSAAHNVILVDGLEQATGPALAEAPLAAPQVVIAPDYDYAQGTFAYGFCDVETAFRRHKQYLWRQPITQDGVDTDATHTRAVLYLRGIGWVVVDRIATSRPRRITPLWHFHPACTVARDGQAVATADAGQTNLRIQPVGGPAWEIDFVSGREGPDFQGWYSPEMDVRVPNTCAVYAADIPGTTTFAWLLLPAQGTVPAAEVTMLPAPEGAVHLQFAWSDSPCIEVAIRLEEATPLALTDGTAVAGHCGVKIQR